MKNKGMVYTTFAIIATGVLITLVGFTSIDPDYTSDKNQYRVSQASYYLENIEEDYSRAQKIAVQGGAYGLVNYVNETGNPVQNPNKALKNATIKGRFLGYNLANRNNATLKEWQKRVTRAAKNSKYELKLGYKNMIVEDKFLTLKGSLKTYFTLEDPKTSTQFNESGLYTSESSIKGLKDPLILKRTSGAYSSTFEICDYQKPAERITYGTQYNEGVVYGEAAVNPTNLSSFSSQQKEEKVLVASDIQEYKQESLDEFTAIVSDDPRQGSYDSKYVFKTDKQVEKYIDDGEGLIVKDDEVWRSSFRKTMNKTCYFKSQGQKPGPGFLERLQNKVDSTEAQGLTTLIDERRLPEDERKGSDGSNVGYVLFQDAEDFGGLSPILGVSEGDSTGFDYLETFRIDRYHVRQWDLFSLAPDFSEAGALSEGIFYVKNGDIYFLDTKEKTKTRVYDSDQRVTVLGPQNQAFDQDQFYEVPFVTENGKLFIVDNKGRKEEIAVNARSQKSKLSIKTGGQTSKIIYAGENEERMFEASTDNSPQEIANPSDGVNSVSGIKDIDGDGKEETVFVDGSQTLRYVDNDGKVVSTGQGIGSNQGQGIGHPYDFNGNGIARIAIVDGSNNLALVDYQGNKQELLTDNKAEKSPIAVIDIDQDNEKEIAFINKNSGNAKYLDQVTGKNNKKTVKPTTEPDTEPGLSARIY